MDNENRAKQFLPFDALKGLKEALHEKEIEHEAKVELSQEQIEKISQDILNLKEKDQVVVYYHNGIKYEKKVGIIKKIDYIRKRIILDENIVNFNDIVNIEKKFYL